MPRFVCDAAGSGANVGAGPARNSDASWSQYIAGAAAAAATS